MPTFGSWSLPGFSKFGSSGAPEAPLKSKQEIRRILHGRVSKPGLPKTKAQVPRYKALNQNIEDDEDDEEGHPSFEKSLDIHTPASQANETDGDQEESQAIKQEEDSSDEGYDNGPQGSSFALGKALMAQRVHSEDSLSLRETDAKNSDHDDTDSEPDPDAAWRLEQIYLNTILNARNEFTLMPLTWKMHFRGIPLPDSLFYIKAKSKSLRPRIYARTDRLEYRGTLALRKLIDVHARIQDIREGEAAVKNDQGRDRTEKRELIKTLSAEMAKQLRRALEQALDWAKQDGETDKYGDQLPSNVRVMELKVISATDEPESEVKIQMEMSDLAKEWRAHALSAGASVQVPVLFGFVIVKHIITIVTLDASDTCAIIHVPCQLHMAEKNQHQWNALAILVTVCWARDVLLDYVNARPDLQPEVKAESSDPDA